MAERRHESKALTPRKRETSLIPLGPAEKNCARTSITVPKAALLWGAKAFSEIALIK